MPRILCALLLALLLAASLSPYRAEAAPLPADYLQAQGTNLVWRGQTVVLKGTNFDNINALGAGIGTNNIDTILFQNADYARVSAEGANHVRFGLSFSWYQQNRTKFFQKLDAQIALAKANRLWVVLNLFTTPGNCYEGYSNHCGIWNVPAEQAALKSFWIDVAGHFAGEPAVAGYDLLNEPTPPGPNYCKTWFNLARDIIPAVQVTAPNQLIFVESCSDPYNDFRYNNPPKGTNVVWQAHDYAPMDMSHDNYSPGSVYPGMASDWYGSCYVDKNVFATGANCPAMNIRESYGITYAAEQGVPIYIGEWGATSRLNGHVQYTQDKAELYRDWGLNHAHYTWRHETVVTGGFHQWGISSTTGGVDDPAKLAAVKISWTGAIKPLFDGSAEVTPPPVVSTATPIVATATRTPTASPTRTATRTATAVPSTPVPGANATNTAQPPPSPPPSGEGSTIYLNIINGALVVTLPQAGGVGILTAPEYASAPSLPAGCSKQGKGIWCWGGTKRLVLPLPAMSGTAAVAQGNKLVTVSWP